MRREQTDSREAPWNPLPLGAALPGGSAARRMGLLVVDRGAEDEDDDGSEERKPMPLTADGPTSRAGLPPPKGPGWTDRVRAPERLDEGLDEFGNRVTWKWMPKGIDQDLWEQIRGATIEGYLGTQAKVLKGFTRACVYTRDYRDLDDLRPHPDRAAEIGRPRLDRLQEGLRHGSGPVRARGPVLAGATGDRRRGGASAAAVAGHTRQRA